MKLKDFEQNAEMNRLRKEMRAESKSWSSETTWRRVELEDALDAFGEVEIPYSALTIEDDNTFTLRGKKVLVYIRDQTLEYYNKGYKFHVANCKTLVDFQNSGRFKKYVASITKDGLFKVNLVSGGKIIEADKIEELKVCKNCLESLNYQGYRQELRKNEAVDRFSIEEFFSLYTHQNVIVPDHTNATSRSNEYPTDWHKVSLRYRKRKKFVCERCSLNLSKNQEYLGVHHISGHKAYNGDDNLRALCVRCHSEQPGHGHMTVDDRYKDFVRKYP